MGSLKIAVAYDDAFCFYYRENFRELERAGLETVFFSPLSAEKLPEGISGLYIGGGYPELHGAELSQNRELMVDIKQKVSAGLPLIAECGGFMYLSGSIIIPPNSIVSSIPAAAPAGSGLPAQSLSAAGHYTAAEPYVEVGPRATAEQSTTAEPRAAAGPHTPAEPRAAAVGPVSLRELFSARADKSDKNYVNRKITSEGDRWSMCGIFSGICRKRDRAVRFGYVRIEDETGLWLPKGTAVRGHEFHYYDTDDNGSDATVYKGYGSTHSRQIHITSTVWAGWPHLYFGSAPGFTEAFYEKCSKYTALAS